MRNAKRLSNEFLALKKDKDIEVKLVNNNYHHWKYCLKGPIKTCYEGGVFDIDIIIPDEYPMQPPKLKFDTIIYHPNISSVNGAICLDILKKEKWNMNISIKQILKSLQTLMIKPVLDDPQEIAVAKQYMTNIKLFNETAKQWVEEYANPKKNLQNKINEIMDMGYNEFQAREALQKYDEDIEKAINYLLGLI